MNPTKRRIALLVYLFLPTACLGGTSSSVQDPGTEDCKILFIGNSLTYANDQPAMVERLAAMAGKSVYVDQSMMSGSTLADHVNTGQTLSKIREQPWDFVILQQAIMAVAFPDMHDGIVAPIQILKDAIHESNTDAAVIYFMDYSMKDGLHWLGEYYTYEASQQMLYDGTLALAENLDLSIGPVGWAWNTAIRDRPDLNLFDADNVHPSYLGSYLGAAVYYATIFQETAVDNPFHGGLNADDAAYLQTVGSETVLDSLHLWNLPALDGRCGVN